jgi:hypothetical protein
MLMAGDRSRPRRRARPRCLGLAVPEKTPIVLQLFLFH